MNMNQTRYLTWRLWRKSSAWLVDISGLSGPEKPGFTFGDSFKSSVRNHKTARIQIKIAQSQTSSWMIPMPNEMPFTVDILWISCALCLHTNHVNSKNQWIFFYFRESRWVHYERQLNSGDRVKVFQNAIEQLRRSYRVYIWNFKSAQNSKITKSVKCDAGCLNDSQYSRVRANTLSCCASVHSTNYINGSIRACCKALF